MSVAKLVGSGIAYDNNNDMFKISSMQKKWRDSFIGSSLDVDNWEVVQMGTGHTITVTGGELNISTGTTINTETILLSKETFMIPFRTLFGFMISQKIANQEFYLEMVSVDPITGVSDDQHSASWRIAHADSATATYAVYMNQNGGLTPQSSAAINTTLSQTAYNILEIEPFADEIWYHARAIDTTGGRVYSAVKHQQIPDPNSVYKIRLRAKNLAVAPASSTNFKLQFVCVTDYAELTAEITSGRGNTAAGQAMAVVVASMPSNAIVGQVAHDSPISGTPVRIAGRALTANYAGVATGDTADFVCTTIGAQVIKQFSIPDLDWQFACASAITTAVDTSLKVAGAAGIRNYVTGFQYQNTNATATEVTIKDGSTVIWRGYAPANMNFPATVTLNTPLRGTAASAMNFGVTTAGASVYVSAQGYQAP